MKKMVLITVGAVCAMAAQLFAATPTVTAVTAQQRYPWNGLVDIVVTISGAECDVTAATCTFAAHDSAQGEEIEEEMMRREPRLSRNAV